MAIGNEKFERYKQVQQRQHYTEVMPSPEKVASAETKLLEAKRFNVGELAKKAAFLSETAERLSTAAAESGTIPTAKHRDNQMEAEEYFDALAKIDAAAINAVTALAGLSKLPDDEFLRRITSPEVLEALVALGEVGALTDRVDNIFIELRTASLDNEHTSGGGLRAYWGGHQFGTWTETLVTRPIQEYIHEKSALEEINPGQSR